jgi:hypothetical protein
VFVFVACAIFSDSRFMLAMTPTTSELTASFQQIESGFQEAVSMYSAYVL